METSTKHKIFDFTKFDKKVNLTLVGLDGNAFYLLGAFKKQAKKEKWTDVEISYVVNKATTGNYEHLLNTLMEHCNDSFGEESDEIIYKNGKTYKLIN